MEPARIRFPAQTAPLHGASGLARFGHARLTRLEPTSGRVVRRYEHAAPCHLDVNKLGRIPDAGGWRSRGRRHRPNRHRGQFYSFLHTAIDDHSRLAYPELPSDECKKTAAAVCARANAHYAACGITVRRVLTDNGRDWSFDFRDALAGNAHKRTALAGRQRRGRTLPPQTSRGSLLLEEWPAPAPVPATANARRPDPTGCTGTSTTAAKARPAGALRLPCVTDLSGQYSSRHARPRLDAAPTPTNEEASAAWGEATQPGARRATPA